MPTPSNHCGECSVCCKRFRMPEIVWMEDVGKPGKPRDILCDKYCNGCTIYETRPQVCADYECLWLKINNITGSIPVELRPDNCGVMVLAQQEDGVGHLLLDEVEANAFDFTNPTPAQQELIKHVVELMANQVMPTTLNVRHYDWTQQQVQIQQK